MEGEKNPKVLLERFRSGLLDQATFSDSLISLIEKSDDSVVRVESIELLSGLSLEDPRLVKLYQDLLISDSDENIRHISAKYLVTNYFEESLEVLEWAIKKDQSLKTLTEVLRGSKLRDKDWLSQIITNIFTTLIKTYDVKRNNIRFYVNSIKGIFNNTEFITPSIEELIEMYQNYRILVELENVFQLDDNFYKCFSKDGYLKDLDLSGLKLGNILDIQGLNKLLRLESHF